MEELNIYHEVDPFDLFLAFLGKTILLQTSLSRPLPTILVLFGCKILFLSERSWLVSGEGPVFLKINSRSIPFTLSIFDFDGELILKSFTVCWFFCCFAVRVFELNVRF